jgi:hypothetical protein
MTDIREIDDASHKHMPPGRHVTPRAATRWLASGFACFAGKIWQTSAGN